MTKVSFLLLLGSLFLFGGCATPSGTAQKLSSQPGSYRDWNDVDEVTIVQPFRFSSYKQVVVLSLDIRAAHLPPSDENTYALAKEVLSTSTQLFTQGISERLSETGVQVTQGPANGPSLIVRARLDKLDPGSIAARMWAPGAGTAQTSISGDIVNSRTNQVLLHFTQERRAAVRTIFQPESVLLSHTLKQIGGDVAGLLLAFR